jgi:hypothetical protein
MSGSTALAGFGLVNGLGTASAGGEDDEDEYEIEELTSKEKGQLRGDVFSSAAFKTIRRTTRDRDYKPDFGEMEAAKLTNTSTGEETKMVRFPCEYVGDADDDKTRGAALFGHKTTTRYSQGASPSARGSRSTSTTASLESRISPEQWTKTK